MSENIGYHTRLYVDHTVKIVGGSFGGRIDQETVERLTRLFEVTVKPSGTPVFVDREGREVRLYLTVDAAKTEKGKAALKVWREEEQRLEAIAEAQFEREQEELQAAMRGLTHEEVLRRLKANTCAANTAETKPT